MTAARVKTVKSRTRKDDHVTRSLVIEINRPLYVENRGEDPRRVTDEEFYKALHAAWKVSTDLANWGVHYLFKRDSPGVLTPDAVKVGTKAEPCKAYLYGAAAGGEFPNWKERTEGVTQSAQCVFRAVHGKYLQDRFDIMVRHESSLLTYRYPYPFPVHNSSWTLEYRESPARAGRGSAESEEEGNRVVWPGKCPVVTLPIPGLGRVSLKLARGPAFGRQLAMLKQIHDGEAVRGEAAIYQNGRKKLFLKITGQFPRPKKRDRDKVCFLHTDPNALLVATVVTGGRIILTNADHLKKRVGDIDHAVKRHAVFLQRVGEDKRRMVQMSADARRMADEKLDVICRRQRNRLKTAVQQIAFQTARFCGRQGVGLVVYDDAVKSYLGENFPYFALKDRIKQLFAGEMNGEWIDGEHNHLATFEEKSEWLKNVTTPQAASLLSATRRLKSHLSRPPRKSHPAVSTPPATSPASGGR